MKILNEVEAEDFLKEEGFPIVERKVIETEEELKTIAKKFNFPLVLKITGSAHKTDLGGVQLVNQEKELIPKFKEIKKIKAGKIIVQKFVPGHSIIIGLKKDDVFGHVLACGLGGIYTEVIKDINFKVCPITKEDAKDMLENLKTFPILEGTRNYEPANIKKILEILIKTSELAEKYPNIKELDINPLIANKKSASIVDALITFD